jgi:hypothetical protein
MQLPRSCPAGGSPPHCPSQRWRPGLPTETTSNDLGHLARGLARAPRAADLPGCRPSALRSPRARARVDFVHFLRCPIRQGRAGRGRMLTTPPVLGAGARDMTPPADNNLKPPSCTPYIYVDHGPLLHTFRVPVTCVCEWLVLYNLPSAAKDIGKVPTFFL